MEVADENLELIDVESTKELMINDIMLSLSHEQSTVLSEFSKLKSIKSKEFDLENSGDILRSILFDNIAKAKALSNISFELVAQIKQPQIIELAQNSLKVVEESIKALSILQKDIKLESNRRLQNTSLQLKVESEIKAKEDAEKPKDENSISFG